MGVDCGAQKCTTAHACTLKQAHDTSLSVPVWSKRDCLRVLGISRFFHIAVNNVNNVDTVDNKKMSTTLTFVYKVRHSPIYEGKRSVEESSSKADFGALCARSKGANHRRRQARWVLEQCAEAHLPELERKFGLVESVAICLFAGVRRSEAIGLTWADVDLERGHIREVLVDQASVIFLRFHPPHFQRVTQGAKDFCRFLLHNLSGWVTLTP